MCEGHSWPVKKQARRSAENCRAFSLSESGIRDGITGPPLVIDAGSMLPTGCKKTTTK